MTRWTRRFLQRCISLKLFHSEATYLFGSKNLCSYCLIKFAFFYNCLPLPFYKLRIVINAPTADLDNERNDTGHLRMIVIALWVVLIKVYVDFVAYNLQSTNSSDQYVWKYISDENTSREWWSWSDHQGIECDMSSVWLEIQRWIGPQWLLSSLVDRLQRRFDRFTLTIHNMSIIIFSQNNSMFEALFRR